MTILLVEETVKTAAMAAAQVHKWQANISMEYLMVTSLRVEEGTMKRKEGAQFKEAMLVPVVVIIITGHYQDSEVNLVGEMMWPTVVTRLLTVAQLVVNRGAVRKMMDRMGMYGAIYLLKYYFAFSVIVENLVDGS